MAFLHVFTEVEHHCKGANPPAQMERCTGRDGVQDAHRADGADIGGSFGPLWAIQPTESLPPVPQLPLRPAPQCRAEVEFKSSRRSLSEATLASPSATCQSVRGKGMSIDRASDALRAAFAAANGARKRLLDERRTIVAEAKAVNELAASVTTLLGAQQAAREAWEAPTALEEAMQRGTADAPALALEAAVLTVRHSPLLAAKALWDVRVVEYTASVDRVVLRPMTLQTWKTRPPSC